MRIPIKGFFSKCDQIRRILWIWSRLLKKPLMKNFILCAVHTLRSAFINQHTELLRTKNSEMDLFQPKYK